MASVVAYLTKDPDPAAPFRFRLGDRVISTLDTAMSGVIVWGRSRYTPGGGLYENIYEVELPDDRHFLAKDMEIELLRTPHTEGGICVHGDRVLLRACMLVLLGATCPYDG